VQAGGPQNQIPLACLDFLENGFDFDFLLNFYYYMMYIYIIMKTLFLLAAIKSSG
jgi:hypothetical protein